MINAYSNQIIFPTQLEIKPYERIASFVLQDSVTFEVLQFSLIIFSHEPSVISSIIHYKNDSEIKETVSETTIDKNFFISEELYTVLQILGSAMYDILITRYSGKALTLILKNNIRIDMHNMLIYFQEKNLLQMKIVKNISKLQ